MYRKIAFQMSGEMLLYTPCFRKETEGNPKTTEELVFSRPAISNSQKAFNWSFRSTENYLWQKHKMDSETDGNARIQYFALNY